MTTTTTDLAVPEESAPALRVPVLPELPDVDSWIRAMASIAKLADKICDTEFVPAAMRGKPDAVTAAILTGRELDLPPMLALRTINMIKGTPSLNAEYMRAKVQSLGHEFRIIEWDDKHCLIHARRKGDRNPPQPFEYTIADARRAGLIRKNKDGSPGKYETDPMAMMLARATTRTCKALFGDVINGLATTELLEAGDDDAAGAALKLPAAAAPPVDDLRRRAAAQTVTAEVVTPDVPPAAAQVPPPAVSVPPSEPAGGTASPGLVGVIQSHLERLGVTERPAKLRVVGLIAGRPVQSSKELTPAEGKKVADTLEQLADGAALDLLRAELEMAGDPRGEDGEPGA